MNEFDLCIHLNQTWMIVLLSLVGGLGWLLIGIVCLGFFARISDDGRHLLNSEWQKDTRVVIIVGGLISLIVLIIVLLVKGFWKLFSWIPYLIAGVKN